MRLTAVINDYRNLARVRVRVRVRVKGLGLGLGLGVTVGSRWGHRSKALDVPASIGGLGCPTAFDTQL